MGDRPRHIELNDNEFPRPQRPNLHVELPSPRTGEAPPALSPLDAFAWQSRLLAKRFEEPAESGKRISRIRHSDVAKEIANRPDFFKCLNGAARSGSDGAMANVPESAEDSSPASKKGGLVSASEWKDRPTSHYPMFGNTGKEERYERPLSTPFETPNEYMEEEEERSKGAPQDYFGTAAPRSSSPEPIDKTRFNLQTPSPLMMPSLTNSVDSVQSFQTAAPPRTLTNGSTRSQRSLAPPKSPAHPKSPRSMQSIRSVPPDSGDDDVSVNGIPRMLLDRKFSGSSGMSRSRPQSPFSPYMHAMPRSPSTMSDYSMNSQRRNFSRPMSSAGFRSDVDRKPSLDSRSSFDTRPSADILHRQPSSAAGSTHPSSGPPSRQMSEDDAETPFATPLPFSRPKFDDSPDSRPSTSYTYTKYPLPRGRSVERNSRGTRESWIQRQFQWDGTGPIDLEPPKPRETRERTNSDGAALEPPSQRLASPALSNRAPREPKDRKARERATSNAKKRSRSVPKTVEKANALHKSNPSVKTQATSSTERTIKALPLHERSQSAELTPDEHLEIGIETHSNGQLNKSTYHLRLAAKAGLPTGMLLYALACRHGWGMRPSQEEGVMWLRKAIDSAGLEVADVEASLASNKPKTDPVQELQERKKRKAQFALAVYELGISYMNGWGCSKDKTLAVSCFEMAGNWGDCDALAEAAFCYTQGSGCKKDLKKAAALYRKAAEGGMSMAGNSWIYKPKYMDDSAKSKESNKEKDNINIDVSIASINPDASKEKDARNAGRARTRSIWGRSKKEKPVAT